jgi:hypothetical protein
MKKYRTLAEDGGVRDALPESARFNRESLDGFLGRYRSVVIKPTGGSGGEGVLFVMAKGDGRYRIRSGKRKVTVRGRDALYRHLRRRTGGRRCLIQRKISLARVDGRPFDVRVMVQRGREPGSRWRVTAKLARIAGRGWLITNTARSGGRVTTYTGAIRRSNIREAEARSLELRIDRLCLRAVRLLHKGCSRLRTVGFDIGLDRDGKPWIIEANFRPSKSLFKRLKDKSLYRRIIRL